MAAGEATEEAIEEATVAAFVEGRGWVVEASEEVVEAWEDTGVDVWAHVQVVKGVGAWMIGLENMNLDVSNLNLRCIWQVASHPHPRGP